MTEQSTDKTVSSMHFAPILLGIIVACVFLIAIFTYQVAPTERALVLTLGKISKETEPGLHFRLPMPIQEVVKYDIRQRSFDGNIGALEEMWTGDQKNVIVGMYVTYRLKDLVKFKNSARNITVAEEYLSDMMRTVKSAVIGKYSFSQMINIDPAKMKLSEMEAEMFAKLAPDLMDKYGIEIVSLGIKTINVPEKISTAIAERMKKERETAAALAKQAGKVEAEKIKTDANKDKREAVTKAEAEAKELMAQGDAAAAAYYSVFNQNPELASFLRKLESLKRIVGTKTTLVLDTDSTPFDIFKMKVGSLNESKAPASK